MGLNSPPPLFSFGKGDKKKQRKIIRRCEGGIRFMDGYAKGGGRLWLHEYKVPSL
jgi:hypothetical protein